MDLTIDTLAKEYKKGTHLDRVNILKGLKNNNELSIKFAKKCRLSIYLLCLTGNKIIVDYCLEVLGYVTPKTMNNGLRGACEGGHMDLVNLMIRYGAYAWNDGLERACLGGHIDAIKLMIEKGANYFETGFCCACKSGNIDAVMYMYDYVKNNESSVMWGFLNACSGLSKFSSDIIDYILEASDYNIDIDTGLFRACYEQNYLAIDYLLKLNANPFDGVVELIEHDQWEVLEYLMINCPDIIMTPSRNPFSCEKSQFCYGIKCKGRMGGTMKQGYHKYLALKLKKRVLSTKELCDQLNGLVSIYL